MSDNEEVFRRQAAWVPMESPGGVCPAWIWNEEVFRRQYPVVIVFVQHLAYYRGLKALWDGVTERKEFWAATMSGHLKLATIAWCNVFGSRKGDLHWTKTPTDNVAKSASQDFRALVLSKTGFTQERWETYHKEMLALRDKYVAHMDRHDPYNNPVPFFEHALQVAYAYEQWARELTKAVIWGQPTLSSLYERYEREAASIVPGPQRPTP